VPRHLTTSIDDTITATHTYEGVLIAVNQAQVSGGIVDGVVVGGTTPAAGYFTNLAGVTVGTSDQTVTLQYGNATLDGFLHVGTTINVPVSTGTTISTGGVTASYNDLTVLGWADVSGSLYASTSPTSASGVGNRDFNDGRYYQKWEFVHETAGGVSAYQPVKLNSQGELDSSFVDSAIEANAHVDAAYQHTTSTGADHSYIDQDLTAGSTVSFGAVYLDNTNPAAANYATSRAYVDSFNAHAYFIANGLPV